MADYAILLHMADEQMTSSSVTEETSKTPSFIDAEYASIDKQYDRKAWWTKVVPILGRVVLAVWSVVDIVLVFGAVIFLVWYLVQGVFEEKQLVARLQQNQTTVRELAVENQAVGLIISNAQVLPGADDRFDLYASITNPNTDWFARFDYHFESSAGATEVQRGYVLPGREYHIAELSQVSERGRPGRAEMIVEHVEWERVKGVPGGDVADWINTHEDIVVSNVNHGAVTTIGSRDVVQTSFTLKNQTAYSYWDLDLILLLRVGRTIVGVNRVRLPYLDSGESLDQSISWFWSPSSGATPEIIPQIDFLNPDVYKAQEGRSTGEIIESL